MLLILNLYVNNAHYQAEAQDSVLSAYKLGENVASFEDEASLMNNSSHLTNTLYSPSSPKTEGSSANNVLAPHTSNGFDYTQASASSPDMMSCIYSVGGTSGLDEYSLPNIEALGLRYDHNLGFPLQVTNSLICETDPMAHHPFGDEDHLQFFDLQSQCHIVESQADLQSAVDSFMLARSTALAIGKAQRRWRKLFNVLKWFMVRNIKSKRSGVPDSERYITGL